MDGYSRIYRVGTLCLAAILLLVLSSCASGERIKTPLTPGEHVQEVELSDGYLYFNTGDQLVHPTTFYGPGSTMTDLSEDFALELLRFDPVAVTASLPEHLQFTWADLVTPAPVFTRDSGLQYPAKGLQMQLIGEPTVYSGDLVVRSQSLTLYCNYAIDPGDSCFPHVGSWMSFTVVPWQRCSEGSDQYHEFTCEKSRVGNLDVGLCYDVRTAALWPDSPDTIYYAGFYVGDRAYGLECHYDYCTQEEFIQVLLAIIDAAVAAAEAGT